MDAINSLKRKYDAISKSSNYKRFMKFGAPMFVFVVGGSFLIEEFQKVRYDHIRNKHDNKMMGEFMKQKNIKVDLKADYEKIKNLDTSNYRNIRGPRPWEDNMDFLKNRESQERRLAELLGKTPTPASSSASQ